MEQSKSGGKKVVRKILKIFGWIAASILLLLILVWILIQIPAVQNYGRKKIVSFLEKKIGTKVAIAHLDIDFPKVIVLEGVYFEDQQRDTLLSGDKLKVDISLFKLLKSSVELNEVALDGITAHISRNAAGTFNFDYIINAFASEDKTPDTTASSMKFSIEKIELDKINLKYHDDYMGYDVVFSLHHFDTDIKTFDLDNSRFKIPEINLDGITSVVKQFKPLGEKIPQADSLVQPSATPAKPLDLKFNNINIANINFGYHNEIDSLFALLQLGQLNVEPNTIDITGEKITLDKLLLKNTTANIHLGKKAEAQKVAKKIAEISDSVASAVKQQGWIFSAKQIELANNNFRFDDDMSPALAKGIDYSHLDIKDLNFKATSVYFQPDSIAGKISDMGFNDKSGVKVDQLHTGFLYTGKQAYLKDLYLKTPSTKLQRSIVLHYPSIESLSKNIGALQMDADLTGTVIGFKDILYFAPSLSKEEIFEKNPNGSLRADIILKGSVADLQVQKFETSVLQNTHIKIAGRIRGLPDINKTFADITINDISSSSTDIYSLVPKGSMPSNIQLPSRLALKGTVKGNMQKLATDLTLRSTLGNAGVNAVLSNITDSINATYNATVALGDFNAGKLVSNEAQLGKVSLIATVIGKGYTPDKMSASAKGVISSAEVKGYTYHNFNFDGTASKGLYDITADIKDPNISLNLTASADLNGKKPAVKAAIMVDSIALQPLHFTTDNIRLHTKIEADIPVLDIDHLQGTILATELLVNTGTKRFVSDTISIVATSTDSINSIALSSPVATAGITGKYTFSGLGTAVQQIINRYYTIGSTTTASSTPLQPQDAAFKLTIFSSAFLKEMMPDLYLSDSIFINGRLNSNESSIVLNGYIPSLKYGTNQIGKGVLRVNTSDSAIIYELDIDQFNSPSFKVPFATLSGSIAHNNLYYNLSVVDNKLKERYLVAGNLLQQDGNYVMSLLPDGVKFDYESWTVNPQNKIMFGKAGVMANAFEISNQGQSLSVQSTTQSFNAPLDIKFANFKIESITKIAGKDSLYLGGTINGAATLSDINTTPVFVADLSVSKFNYKKDTLGDIAIKVNNRTANTYTADISITGNDNSINASGNYVTTGNGSFDFDLDIQKLNLASIESFTFGNLRQMSGYMEGKLKIAGNASAPRINGDLAFKQAVMNVAMINSTFRLDDEEINFKEDGIHFDQFAITDSAGNQAIIDGTVYTSDYRDYRFSVDINADDFMVMNSKKRDNPPYYGKLFIDAGIKIRGDMDKPVVNADITVNEKTDVTILTPQNNPQAEAREGIVVFFDQDHPELDSMLMLKSYDSLRKSDIKGLDISANLEIDKNAAFSMIIDEANGDFVKVKGEASLSGGIDPSGKTSLTGTYELKEGAYEMSFNFLKRKFNIKEGSTITWNGEPTSADVNLVAIYKANAAPIDLVAQQLTDVNDDVKNTYRQKLPFEVWLNMTGELLKPVISFDIVLPEGNYNVSTDIVNASNSKLAQIRQEPSEMNKQAFALLLFGRFVDENPFESGSSTSVSTMAKQSVSKLLAEQLNRLAADLIGGIDINFGLESTDDYTTGTQQSRTDLTVGVSKQLLNDRLKVSVGSNFELEGPTQTNQKTNNIAGDVQIDYKLSKDGRYMLRGYRKDQYEVALQGQVVETGLKFIIIIDYDEFREILERSKQKKVLRKEKKAEKKAEEPQEEQKK